MLQFTWLRPVHTSLASVLTVFVWAAAVASIAFWVLHQPNPETLAAATVTASMAHPSSDPGLAVARALGQRSDSSTRAITPSNAQHKLLGVIASASGQGSALIATDGQPPKAYRVGQSVQDGWTLTALTARQARLQSQGAEVVLELPAANQP